MPDLQRTPFRHAQSGAQAIAGAVPRARRKLDPLRLSLLALLLLTVSRIHSHFPFIAALRPGMVLAAFALLYAVLKPNLVSGTAWFRTWPARVVAALGVLACLSAVFGISFGAAARYILEDYSKELLFVFLLMATIRGVRDLSLYVWAYVLSAGVLVWLALFVFGVSRQGATGGILRSDFAYTYDANDLGLVLLVALGLTLLTLETSRLKGKLVSGAILLGIGACIARTGSRGAFLGLLAVGAVLLLSRGRVSIVKRLCFLAATVVSLVLGTPSGYWRQMSTVTRPREDYNWNSPLGRRQLALRGLGYMKAYPFFGIGIGNFPRAEGTISPLMQHWEPGNAGIRWSAPHNSYLQVGSELGVPGLIVWSSLVFGGVLSMRRVRRSLPTTWARGDPEQRFLYLSTIYLPVCLVGFGVSAMFISFAYSDPIYVLAAFMTGVYVSVWRKLAELEGSQGLSTPRRAMERPSFSSLRPLPRGTRSARLH